MGKLTLFWNILNCCSPYLLLWSPSLGQDGVLVFRCVYEFKFLDQHNKSIYQRRMTRKYSFPMQNLFAASLGHASSSPSLWNYFYYFLLHLFTSTCGLCYSHRADTTIWKRLQSLPCINLHLSPHHTAPEAITGIYLLTHTISTALSWLAVN